MKQGKKFLALLLCLVMVCSMIPFAAAAEESTEGNAEAASAALMMCEVNDGKDGPLESNYALSVNSSILANFYFVVGEEKTPVLITELGCDGPISISKFEDTDFVELRTDSSGGEGVVTYTYDGVVYSFLVNVSVPGGGEPEEDDSQKPITIPMTAVEYAAAPNGPAPTGNIFDGEITANAGMNLMLQFKVGEVVLTDPSSDASDIIEVSIANGTVYNVRLLKAGTATLKAKNGDVTYSFTITVADNGSSGNQGEGNQPAPAQSIMLNGTNYEISMGTIWIRYEDDGGQTVVCSPSYIAKGVVSSADVTTFDYYISLYDHKKGEDATEADYKEFWENYSASVSVFEDNITVSEVKTADDGYHKYVTITVTGVVSGAAIVTAQRVTGETELPEILQSGNSVNVSQAVELTLSDDGTATFEVANPERWKDYFFYIDLGDTKSGTISGSMTMEGAYGYLWVQGDLQFWSKYDDNYTNAHAGNFNCRYILFSACMYSENNVLTGSVKVSLSDSGSQGDGDEGGGSEIANELLFAYVGSTDAPKPLSEIVLKAGSSLNAEIELYIGTVDNPVRLQGAYLQSSDDKIVQPVFPPAETGIDAALQIGNPGSVTLSCNVDGVLYSSVVTVISNVPVLTGKEGKFVGEEGEWVPGTEATTSKTIYLTSSERIWIEFFANQTKITDKIGLISSNGNVAEVTWHQAGAWEIHIKAPGIVEFSATVDGETFKYVLTVYAAGDGNDDNDEKPVYSSTAKITVGGVTYDAAIVDAASSGTFTFLTAPIGFDHNGYLGCFPDTTYLIGAMSGVYTDRAAEAPANVYKHITDVSVEVISYVKFGATGNQDAPSFQVGKTMYNGIEMYSVRPDVQMGDYFKANVLVRITVLDDKKQLITYTLSYVFQYAEDLWFEFDANETSAEGLNQILASDEAFYQWVQSQYPEEYQKIQAAYVSPVPQRVIIRLYLPAVTYSGIVRVGITEEKGSMFICGTRDEYGKATTLPGLWISGQIYGAQNINFVADERYKQTYGSEEFTCGILYCGTNTSENFANAWSTDECSFSGFKYAIRATETGYGMGISRCAFADCEYGIYIDSKGSSNPYIHDSLFVRNGTAVLAKEIGASPYNFRVTNCDLIENDVDFDIEAGGTFYFHGNYFGSFQHLFKMENEKGGRDTAVLVRILAEMTSDRELNYAVIYQHAKIRAGWGTRVITNPRWLNPLKAWNTYGWVPFDLDNEEPYENYLTSDWAYETQIVNEEANGLLIDGSAFIIETEEKKVIDMVDENENAVGTWIFD